MIVDASQAGQVRFKMPSDVIFLPTPDGVEMRNSVRAFLLKGRGAYTLVEALAPRLNGEATFDEITRAFPEKARKTIHDICEMLLERGFLKIEREAPRTVPSDLAPFRNVIRYIDHFATDAVSRFERFRNARVLVAGGGLTAMATAHALIELGLSRILSTSDLDEHGRMTAYLRDVDALARTAELQVVDGQNVAGFDVVLVAADMDDASAASLGAACRSARTPLLMGRFLGSRAVVGPWLGGDETGCQVCAMAAAKPRTGERHVIGAAAAAIVGNELAREVLRRTTGVEPTLFVRRILVLDEPTLSLRLVNYTAAPSCSECQRGET